MAEKEKKYKDLLKYGLHSINRLVDEDEALRAAGEKPLPLYAFYRCVSSIDARTRKQACE